MLTITALYAGLLGLMAVVLAAMSGLKRTQTQVSIGDGGNTDQLLAMRRHGNFIEFVPLALILIGILELNGVGSLALHGLGAGLLVFRIAHAVSLRADTLQNPGRGIGAGGTTLVIVVASIWCLVTFF